MFTGLIQEVGKIEKIEPRQGGIRLGISARLDPIRVGDSVSVSGVCLTVVSHSGNGFVVEVSPETLKTTTLSDARAGEPVNLEAALRVGDSLGGHLVSGHVDGTGVLSEIVPEGNAWRYRFRAPANVSRYIVEKGSITVDGISLTVAEIRGEEFGVSVIPHTAQITTLGKKKAGDRVNLEADMIAKYVEKFVRPDGKESRIDSAFLARHGFGKSRE